MAALRLPSKIGQHGHAARKLLGDKATRDDMLDYLLYQVQVYSRRSTDLRMPRTNLLCFASQGGKLLGKNALSIPAVKWDGATVEERDAIDRLGFLFDNYVCDQYYYEIVEMVRSRSGTDRYLS
eukprot:3932784-Rhodomonas_salina.1